MKTLFGLLLALSLLQPVCAQSLDPAKILEGARNNWPTYSGDYSGTRFSSLDRINEKNVKGLALQWMSRLYGGPRGAAGAAATIIGGEGVGESTAAPNIRGAILQVDGILYASVPDNAWALDALDGHELWHFFWKTKGGTHIGNRGMAMWRNRLYMETPDNYLICLDAKTGKEIWHKEIADFDLQYFSTMAPIVVGNHVLVGTGNDLDEPGFIQAMNPETGEVQWRFYTVPMKHGDPGLDTWRNLDAASHGGGNVWIPGSYDPETHLYIFGTGNPSAAYTSSGRGPGDNLFTCSLIALDVETGKMAWYFQTSPHDTHDYDSAQTPVLADALFNGRTRKLVMTAARNGYFFVLDRRTGEHLLTKKFSSAANWSSGVDKRGEPVRDPSKDFDIGGSLVSPNSIGAVNWPPPSFNPQTGLFYVQSVDSYSVSYLTTLPPKIAMGLGGKDEATVGQLGSYLNAIDYRSGKTVWQHRYPGLGNYGIQNGLLSTAGGLLFASDPSGNLIAFAPATGIPLWHARIGVSNAPQTYIYQGTQYVLVAGGDTLYAFSINP